MTTVLFQQVSSSIVLIQELLGREYTKKKRNIERLTDRWKKREAELVHITKKRDWQMEEDRVFIYSPHFYIYWVFGGLMKSENRGNVQFLIYGIEESRVRFHARREETEGSKSVSRTYYGKGIGISRSCAEVKTEIRLR